MGIDLYYRPLSAPCRSVIMVAKELNIQLELKELQVDPDGDFLKINPWQTVPTMVDHDNNGFILWESRAIMKYLVNQYSPGHSLYPSDVKKRSEIDKFLYLDMGTIYKSLFDWYYPVLQKGQAIDGEKVEIFNGKLALLDGLIGSNQFVTGDTLSLADLALVSTLSLVMEETPIYMKIQLMMEKPNIDRWLSDLKSSLPYYDEINKEASQQLKEFIEAKMSNFALLKAMGVPFDLY